MSNLPDPGLVILRVGVGVQMIALHGWDKLQNFSQKAGSFSDPLHIGSRLSLTGAIAGEVGCALLLILGLGTRVAAAGLAFTMCVAAFLHHAADPWKKRELALLYLVAAVAILLLGPGRFSIDAALWPRLRKRSPGHA